MIVTLASTTIKQSIFAGPWARKLASGFVIAGRRIIHPCGNAPLLPAALWGYPDAIF